MSKKSFTGGLNSLLGETGQKTVKSPGLTELVNKPGKQKVGRPVTQTKEITKSSQQGTKENETRATFIIREDLLEQIKAISYWDRLLFKDVVNAALQEYVVKSKVKPRPETERVKEQNANQRLIRDPHKQAKLPKF